MTPQEELLSNAFQQLEINGERRAPPWIVPVLDREQLGEGVGAIVYKGTWTVAVKRIPSENYKKNEEKALKKLNHPNVVKLFQVYDDGEFKYCALEFCHASMDQLFKGSEEQKKYCKKMPDIEVCLQLAKGLAYIHQMKLIHRDLKPENVLIWVNPQNTDKVLMKWADFEDCESVNENGWYIFTDDKKSIGGTHNWHAPEIVKILIDRNEQEPKPHVGTVKSDVFSQGLVFGYYILGEHPYPEGNIKQHILDSNPANLNNKKRDHCMYNIIMEMLEKEPDNRISSADVVEKIKTWVTDNSLSARQ